MVSLHEQENEKDATNKQDMGENEIKSQVSETKRHGSFFLFFPLLSHFTDSFYLRQTFRERL